MSFKFAVSAILLIGLGSFTALAIFTNAIFAQNISNPISGLIDPTPTPDTTISSPIDPTPEPTVEPTTVPTEAPSNNNNSNPGGNSDSGSNGGGGSSQGPQACGDSKPGLPVLLSATKTGAGQVTLKWYPASGSKTHYTIVYGVKPNQPLYGNPNASGPSGNQYTIKGLSAKQTYFFKIAAVNNCMPGDFSNELASAPIKSGSGATGSLVTKKVAQNFQPAIMGKTKVNVSAPTAKPEVKVNQPDSNVINLPKESTNTDQNWTNKVKSFFKNILG